jgi:alkanesulfonate monooxygenase SsuD/methylene tetrahydromethanopterin reductase-like flavin-dependent oxidoreductase (luciferase family)
MVTPLPRRRPAKLAKELMTLDHLSGGRVVAGVELGVPAEEYTAFGEPADPRLRAAKLDEGLLVLDGLLRGEHVSHTGPHHRVDVRPTPGCVQRPRPPIWVAATWPHQRPLARAARYDGVFAIGSDSGMLTPEQVRATRAAVGPAADVVVPHDPAVPAAAFAEAGATWLVTGPASASGWAEAMLGVAAAGPPRE